MKRYLPLFVVIILLLAVSLGATHAQETVNITVRCMANVAGGEGWRCDNFSEVKDQVAEALGVNIELNLIQDSPSWGDYKQEFVLASEAGEAPDIILSGHEDIGAWAPAGYIVPLDDMIAEHTEFADVVPNLWESQKFDGQTYGVPQDAEARPVFYSKLLLSDLGWSAEEIESLPERVAAGEFTFADMIATAQQAIDEGVVEPGNGFWHRPSNGPDFLYYYLGEGGEVVDADGNLVVDRESLVAAYALLGEMTTDGVMRQDLIGIDWSTEWHPAVASAETVLFAASGTWNWADWAKNYVADRGGNDYLLENIGLTLIPAMDTGAALTVTHPLSYMVSASSEHPDVAMALIAAVTTPDANNRHAIDSFHLGILQSQVESEAYANNEVLSSAHYMLDYARFLPNHPGWNSWSTAYWTGIQAVEAGDATPEEAADIMISQLQNEIPDVIVQ